MSTKQEEIKSLLEKINLLFRIFEKDGVNKISKLEKELLKEQAVKLVKAIDELDSASDSEVKQTVEAVVERVEPIVQQPVQPKIVTPKVETPRIEFIAEDTHIPKPAATQPVQPKPEPVVEIIKEAPKTINKNLRNLRQIIDLNKSFQFKKELFDNNQEEYTSFIDGLNNIQDEEESVQFAVKTAEEKGWDLDDKTYELVLRAIEKRFSPILG